VVGTLLPLEADAIGLNILAPRGYMILMEKLNEGTHPLGVAFVYRCRSVKSAGFAQVNWASCVTTTWKEENVGWR